MELIGFTQKLDQAEYFLDLSPALLEVIHSHLSS